MSCENRRVFALSDPHLSGAQPKPMDIFGPHWQDHQARIEENWRRKVGQEDIVLMPGDISWAMTMQDARTDLDFIGSLPGKKVLLRGNHDYWWNSVTKVRAVLPEGMYVLQNECLLFDGVALAGTRGWTYAGENSQSEDRKIYLREIERLRLSLGDLKRKAPEGWLKLGMTHYPPFSDSWGPSPFTQLFAQYGVEQVCYGHIHNSTADQVFQGEMDGVEYRLVSADHLRFDPYLVAELPAKTNA